MTELQFDELMASYEFFIYLIVGIVFCFAAFSGFKTGVSS